MLKTIWEFIKHPTYQEDENKNLKYRISVFGRLLFIGLITSILLLNLASMIQNIFGLDTGDHAIEEMWDTYSLPMVIFLGVIVAPFFEELLFRGTMVFFRNSLNFKYIFYVLTLVFGYIHISNFEITTTTLLLSPLLVAPQIAVGALFGFIRVRFGLIWAILLHATYNLVLFVPFVIAKVLDIPLE